MKLAIYRNVLFTFQEILSIKQWRHLLLFLILYQFYIEVLLLI